MSETIDPSTTTTVGLHAQFDALKRDVRQADLLVHDAIKQLATGFMVMRSHIATQDQVLKDLLGRVRRLSEGGHASGVHPGLEELSQAMGSLLQDFVDHILRTSTDSMEVMHGLGDMSGRMKQVETEVVTVSQLASQTRLLALNAAIEASHAGAAGRGFGVVAGEVKSLSQGSATCSERIEESVTGARQILQRLHVGTEKMASADMTFALERKARMDIMLGDMATVNDAVATGIGEANSLRGTVSQDVGAAIAALRFEESVRDLLGQVSRRIEAIEAVVATAPVTGRDPPPKDIGPPHHRSDQELPLQRDNQPARERVLWP